MFIRSYRPEEFTDTVAKLYPELYSKTDMNDSHRRPMTRTVTFQVTDNCNLACKYCYQINKGKRRMSFETAKKLVDALLDNDPKIKDFISADFSPGIILDFIGGEPLLEIELIEKICDYFVEKATNMCHQWATLFRISLCSNGLLYFDPKVQHFFEKYSGMVSFNVTIDGNKELHDSCRVTPDGQPSYDRAVAAAQDWMKNKGYYMGSKITIAPGNIDYLYDAIMHMISLGYVEINANCVFEKGWNLELANKFYIQLKRIADYWIDNDLVPTHYIALFQDMFFKPQEKTYDENWCGGTGAMLAMDPDGYLYPCIRYMESSVGTDVTPLRIGHIDTGIAQDKKTKCTLDCLDCIKRRSQETDMCFECPIATGCAWCSGYNYQMYGTANKQATFICQTHQARALANAYFWNKWYRKINSITSDGKPERFKIWMPKEWALKIIDENEWNMLKELESTEGIGFEND